MALSRRGPGSFFDEAPLSLWDPMGHSVFRGLFPDRELFAPSATGAFPAAFTAARFDWRETDDAHVITADLPGLRKEEVKIELEDNAVLKISGERSSEKEEKTDTWHRVERSSGKFFRSFPLPQGSRPEGIKAAMENGVLTVTVPKSEAAKRNVKSIEISGQ